MVKTREILMLICLLFLCNRGYSQISFFIEPNLVINLDTQLFDVQTEFSEGSYSFNTEDSTDILYLSVTSGYHYSVPNKSLIRSRLEDRIVGLRNSSNDSIEILKAAHFEYNGFEGTFMSSRTSIGQPKTTSTYYLFDTSFFVSTIFLTVDAEMDKSHGFINSVIDNIKVYSEAELDSLNTYYNSNINISIQPLPLRNEYKWRENIGEFHHVVETYNRDSVPDEVLKSMEKYNTWNFHTFRGEIKINPQLIPLVDRIESPVRFGHQIFTYNSGDKLLFTSYHNQKGEVKTRGFIYFLDPSGVEIKVPFPFQYINDGF